MSYAEKFLKSKGQDCTINRSTPLETKVSIKRSTNASRDLGAREGYWEGLILYDASLVSGEIITIRDNKYLVQTVNYDPASLECAFFAAKCNALVQHKRYTETVDENNNLIKQWPTINSDVSCFGEVVTYRLRQEDPGLLDSTKYTFQVPKSLGVKELDRFVYDNNNYQVESIDDIGLSGVARVQLATDTRAN